MYTLFQLIFYHWRAVERNFLIKRIKLWEVEPPTPPPNPQLGVIFSRANLGPRSYTAKETHIALAVTEILRYRQTQILLLLYKDVNEPTIC